MPQPVRLSLILLILALTLHFPLPAHASHQWGCFAWDKTNLGVRTFLRDGSYAGNWEHGRAVWDALNTPLGFSYTPGRPDIVLWAGAAGQTGWEGLGVVFPAGCTIRIGIALLNDTYLSNKSSSWRNAVACQELGHTIGLEHNRSQSDTCMNDLLRYPYPNQHDADQLNSMY